MFASHFAPFVIIFHSFQDQINKYMAKMREKEMTVLINVIYI